MYVKIKRFERKFESFPERGRSDGRARSPAIFYVRPYRTQPAKSGHFDKAAGQRGQCRSVGTNRHFFEHRGATRATTTGRPTAPPLEYIPCLYVRVVRGGEREREGEVRGLASLFGVRKSRASRTEKINFNELNLNLNL